MAVHSFHLKTPRTARVATLGTGSDRTRQVWLVVHGYRMLASSFIQRFALLDDGYHWIVAPEGLSRFYVDGFYGQVGASWMTREDREAEIEDHVQYLDSLMLHIREVASAPVHILGFSQGVATVWRHLMLGKEAADSVTIWTGGLPRESSPLLKERLEQIPLFHVTASEDAFIPVAAFAEQDKKLHQNHPLVSTIDYAGGHEIETAPLKILRQYLDNLQVFG